MNDSHAEAIYPVDKDAELSVLGAVLLDNLVMNELRQRLTSNDFYYSLHKEVFRRMCKLWDAGSNIDITLVAEADNELRTICTDAYAICTTSLYALDYARRVRECSQKRYSIDAAQTLARYGYNGKTPAQIGEFALSVAEHLKPFDAELDRTIYRKYPFLEGIEIEIVQGWIEEWRAASATEGGESRDMLQFIEYWKSQDSHDVVPGVLPRGEVILIAGESGVGKSYLGAEMFATCLMGGKWWGRYDAPKLTPLYCLTEDQKGWSKRLLAHLNAAGWKPDERMGYVRNDLPRLFEQGNYNRSISGGYEWFLRIRADQHRGILPPCLDVLFVDYLRDASPGADEQSNNDMSLVMDGANQLARALNLLLVLLHHRGANTEKATRGATVVVDKSHAVFVLTGDLHTEVKMEAAKPPKGIARPAPIAFKLNDASGNTPILEYVGASGDSLGGEIYHLLRYTFPGERLSLAQLQIELPAPADVSEQTWKQRINRAAKAVTKDAVKYPGIDYELGRSGGYKFSL